MRYYGLKPEELNKIRELFQEFFGDIPKAKVFLFGSRAKGIQKSFSDIDIAIKAKSEKISQKISLFKEKWEKTKLPYKIDISNWKDIYKPYLPQVRKDKITLWEPKDKPIHPWRACPYGQHWVIRHPRYPVGRQIQDVDGHCRKNPSGKDLLHGEEIEFISKIALFQETSPLPCLYQGTVKISSANDFDILISGWCKYWNDIFKPDIPISSNFVKALIESESKFNPNAIAQNKKSIGPARGLIQITEQTLKILKNKKGEIKDHYVELTKEELFDPSKNICAAVRWLFQKRKILQKRLGRPPKWVETVVEYKGLGRQLKNNGPKALRIMKDFSDFFENYIC